MVNAPRGFSAQWGLLLMILGVFILTVAINHATFTNQSIKTPSTYHTPAWLKQHLTLGYDRTLSVLYWFDVISNFGGKLASETDYSILAKNLDAITTLDPYAGHAYYMAATVLTWQIHSTKLSEPLLKRGITRMPNDWRWPYYLGFYSYFFDHNTQMADKYLTIATSHADVPPMLISLVSKIRAAHTGLDTALLFLQQMLKKKQNSALTDKLEEEIKRIRTEKVLRALDSIITRIPDWDGDPQRLQNIGVHLPDTLPDGGNIIFDQHHHPISSAENKRYQLFQPPSHSRKSP